MPARIAPRDARRQRSREAFEARVVLVGDPRLAGLRERVHAQQVRAFVRGEAQIPGEDAHREARVDHLNRLTVGFHAARRRVKRRVGAADVGLRARGADVAGARRHAGNAVAAARGRRRGGRVVDAARRRTGLPGRLCGARAARRRHLPHLRTVGQHERRIPERIPAVLVDDRRRQLDARADERLGLLHAHAADAADDVVLGREVLPDRGPRPARLAHRELAHGRRAALDREARAQFLVVLAVPRHDERVLLDARRQPRRGLVLAHVALHRVGQHDVRRSGHDERGRKRQDRRGSEQHDCPDPHLSSSSHAIHRLLTSPRTPRSRRLRARRDNGRARRR